MKKVKHGVLMAYMLLISSATTFIALLFSANALVGEAWVLVFIVLAWIMLGSFGYLLVKSQLLRNLLKGYFGMF